MTSHYYSSGKLMISGEYLVLHGALAFAIPVRYGQILSVTGLRSEDLISWETRVKESHWFDAQFSYPDLDVTNYSDAKTAVFIQNLLRAARILNPGFLADENRFKIECQIDFDINWGLGSSSSLISNLAWWARVDPFELHAMVSKGSGYDIACARSTKPVLFQNINGIKRVSHIDFHPVFSKNLYFIYLGKKKDSQGDVDLFLENKGSFRKEIEQISSISSKMAICNNYNDFASLMWEHESIMADVLGRPTLKNDIFNDFPGQVKSLGAWGGDFAMALWPAGKDDLSIYLSHKNLNTFFSINEMMYQNAVKQNQ